MRRTEMLQEVLLMRFEEIYGTWTERHLICLCRRQTGTGRSGKGKIRAKEKKEAARTSIC
ncbi:MAG: hypothetical protein HZB79_06015 [Deltaproteobacteria bacterium]|nr:hypothetical protein [Deltaproteobacteria bacterium]MBI5893193.1 hypothetical protein [Deltaproteobacteria bacterium]